uniref:Uncharacterized protein n=1 Tax=Moniliophthora roreri TaxID=221103 RepID=A0A0W0FQJ5_MONRR
MASSGSSEAPTNDSNSDAVMTDSTERGVSCSAPDLGAVKDALKGVSDNTLAGYQSLDQAMQEMAQGSPPDQTRGDVLQSRPSPRLTRYDLCLDNGFIRDSLLCDSIRLDGTVRPETEVHKTYSHAQKMQAAVTFVFGQLFELGNTPWSQSESPSIKGQGQRTGNQCSGHYTKNWKPQPANLLLKNALHKWGHPGPYFHCLFHLMYMVALACLLQIDEVLNIKFSDIKIVEHHDGKVQMIITLPYQKTSQFEEIKPFILLPLPEEMRHLCPVHAYSEWIDALNKEEGYMFCKIKAGDQIGTQDQPITSQQFLKVPILSIVVVASGL